MLFTWDTNNLCIIFRWWHINGVFSLLVSLVAVAILTAGYEVVREASRRYEVNSAEYANSLPSMSAPRFLTLRNRRSTKPWLKLEKSMMMMLLLLVNEAHSYGQEKMQGNMSKG